MLASPSNERVDGPLETCSTPGVGAPDDHQTVECAHNLLLRLCAENFEVRHHRRGRARCAGEGHRRLGGDLGTPCTSCAPSHCSAMPTSSRPVMPRRPRHGRLRIRGSRCPRSGRHPGSKPDSAGPSHPGCWSVTMRCAFTAISITPSVAGRRGRKTQTQPTQLDANPVP